MMSPMSAEATVVRNYIDWVIALPWEEKTGGPHDITEAEQILDDEHYGLKKVKERILEYLAVQALVDEVADRSSASSARPASARRRSPARSRTRPAASSCASRSAACATRRRSAATAARTSARCPAR